MIYRFELAELEFTSACFTLQLQTKYYVTVTLGWHDSSVLSVSAIVLTEKRVLFALLCFAGVM